MEDAVPNGIAISRTIAANILRPALNKIEAPNTNNRENISHFRRNKCLSTPDKIPLPFL
jgi:hypothetical protein